MKRNSTKGFTLIELLAVIVILAIIALITVPLVYKMVNKAKDELSVQNVDGYINAAELAVSKHGFDSDDDVLGVYDITPTGIKKQGTDLEFVVNVKGDRPTSGTITFDEDANVIAVNIPVSDSKSIVMDDQGRLKKVTVTNPGEELEEGKLFIRETLNGTIQVKVNDVLQDSLEIAYQKGDKVTITFVPNDGYILEDYTCEFLSGNLKGNNSYDKVMDSLKEYEVGAVFTQNQVISENLAYGTTAGGVQGSAATSNIAYVQSISQTLSGSFNLLTVSSHYRYIGNFVKYENDAITILKPGNYTINFNFYASGWVGVTCATYVNGTTVSTLNTSGGMPNIMTYTGNLKSGDVVSLRSTSNLGGVLYTGVITVYLNS